MPDAQRTPAGSLARAALGGVVATIAMDLSARTLVAPLLGVEAPGPRDLGRWLGHMGHGRFRHEEITAAPAVRGEATIGVLAHYVIGATLGTGYGLLLRVGGHRYSSLPSALSYGTGTTIFSWLVMFPATGRGLLGRRESARLGALSLANHIVYGLGLGAAGARLTPRR